MAVRRLSLALCLVLSALPASVSAQADGGRADADQPPDAPNPGSPYDAESYVALSADQAAQESLGGFRRYLERTRDVDAGLYRVLDARLDDLETRDTAADVIFWTATGLSVGALVAAIPVHETLGLDPALGFIIGGASTFVLGLIIQAIVRPSHGDLVALIDLHDQRLGRR